MEYTVDTGNAEENIGGFVLIPEGTYEVQIVEKADKTTSKGDPMVNIKFEILNGDFKGKWLFDNIVIPGLASPAFKIMGRTMHFLHVIDQPYKGKFSFDSDRWMYSKLKVKVKHKTQEQGKYAGQKVATIAEHDFFDVDSNGLPDPDIPF